MGEMKKSTKLITPSNFPFLLFLGSSWFHRSQGFDCSCNLPTKRVFGARCNDGVSPTERFRPRLLSQQPVASEAEEGEIIQTGSKPQPSKRKKNKYAKFSRVAGSNSIRQSDNKDPWEMLMEESKHKQKQLQIEKDLMQNKIKFEDIDEISLEDPEDKNDENARTISISLSKGKKKQRKRERNVMIFPDTTQINPYDPTTFGYIELGIIIGAHGVNGLVKIAASTDFASTRLCPTTPTIRHLKPHSRRSPREIKLLEGRPQINDVYILKFEGVGSRDAAMKLKGSVLYARQEDERPQMEDDEYFISELVGLEVYLEDTDEEGANESETKESVGGEFVGVLKGVVLQEDLSGTVGLGYDFLEIALPQRVGTQDQLVLIPFVPQIVPHVDINARCVYINPPNGLLDLAYVRQQKVRIKGFLPPAR